MTCVLLKEISCQILRKRRVVLFTTKLLGAEVKNSEVILRIVLPILTKFLQKKPNL